MHLAACVVHSGLVLRTACTAGEGPCRACLLPSRRWADPTA